MPVTQTTIADSGAQMRSKVEAVLGLIAQNAERAESDRRVPTENIDALRDAGF
jgi:hypothetical protein